MVHKSGYFTPNLAVKFAPRGRITDRLCYRGLGTKFSEPETVQILTLMVVCLIYGLVFTFGMEQFVRIMAVWRLDEN